MSITRGLRLVGRRSECDALEDMLIAVRQGLSASRVIRGEAGMGKTALLEHLVRHATDCQVLSAFGVESDMELAFAGLQQLCAPLMSRVDELPEPQREAIGTAFGLVQGEPPDRFLVGLAALTLLATAADAKPVLAVVDDAQWLDRVSAQTLGFVARRLTAESVALVFAMREPASMQHLAGIEDLELRGLDDGDAHALLTSVLPGPLDRAVRERIVAETHGNPLALLELPQRRSAAELAFGFQDPELMPMATRIELDYQRRLDPLPHRTRQLLLTAAAEPVGDTPLLWRAADLLGIAVEAAPAKAAGLIEFGDGIRFRHPLVRSAVYRSATPEERRRAHRALAEATDANTDPDRRAWHRAQACAGPDEAVASDLEASAERAHSRGGFAAAAALLERAAALTQDPRQRGARALAAAEAEYAAAAPETASELAAMAKLCPLDDLQQARLSRLEAQVQFAQTRGGTAAQDLLTAAQRLDSIDARLARETYLEAISAAIVSAPLGGPHGVRAVAAAALAAPAAGQQPSPSDALLDGVATWLTEGYSGFSAMRVAFHGFAEARLTGRRETMSWLLNCFVALQIGTHQIWDLDAWDSLASHAVRRCRELGALSALPIAVMSLAGAKLYAGDLKTAANLTDEGNAITAATRHAPIKYTTLNLAAWRGDEAAAMPLIEQVVSDAAERGETYVLGLAGYVTAVLYNGLGRYDLAQAGARRVSQRDGFSFRGWALAELVEAAVRTGDLEEAAAARAALAERSHASGTDWALGLQAQCDALLSDGENADRLYLDAIERLRRAHVSVQQARAHLLYGEWLRRRSRRRDAREQLRTALDMCTTMGLQAFADRADRELRGTGETTRRRTHTADHGLTSQESQIARLAANGLTNPEIGAHLFISPHTVEWHLRKVFNKLDISSRRQLAGVLRDGVATSELA